MSLLTDKIFKAAIMSNGDLLALVTPEPTSYNPHPKPRLYNTAIPLPDEDADNVPVPYIIIMNEGTDNDQGTKDDYEGDTDTVNIGIEVAATTRGQLGTISQMIRDAVHDFFVNYDIETEDLGDLIPIDYHFSATRINYDPDKPCYWMVLNYQCDTNR